MTITTVMTFFVIRFGWKYPLVLCAAATGIFFLIDVTFLASNLLKIAAGGWFPLLIGVCMFTLMLTWRQGRRMLSDKLREDAIELPSFLDAVFLSPPTRVPGTAVFLSAELGITPNALMHNLKHNKVLHEQNVFVTVRHHEVPWIGFDKRCEVESLGHNCWQVTLHFGFKNEPDVPEAPGPAQEPWRAAGRDGDQLLPQPRHRHPHHRGRHGAVARSSLPACTATRRPRPTSCTCLPTASSSWAAGERSRSSLVGLNPAAWRRAPPDNRAPCCPISWPPAAGASAPSSPLYVTEGIPSASPSPPSPTTCASRAWPAEIGAFVGSFYVPWAFKWAFGPFVDVFGRSASGTAGPGSLPCSCSATLAVLVFFELPAQRGLFTAVLFVHNTFGAIQDVAIDSLACNTLHEDERGLANGLMFAGAAIGQAIGVLASSSYDGLYRLPVQLLLCGGLDPAHHLLRRAADEGVRRAAHPGLCG